MTEQYEIDAAYFQGLREGFDPEVAEDLGIPMDPDTVEKQIESAREVGKLIGTTVLPVHAKIESPATGTRKQWVDSMHLTQPSSGGPLRHPTPEDGRFATNNMNKVRAANHKVSSWDV